MSALTQPQELCLIWESGQIRQKDIVTLSNQEWVNDECINYAAWLLWNEFEQQSVYVDNSFFFEDIQNALEAGTVKELIQRHGLKKKSILDVDHYVLPVNKNKNHWILVVVSYLGKMEKKPSILVVDSLETMRSTASPVFTSMRNFIVAALGNDRREIECLQAKNFQRQANYYDCGVFLIMFMELFLRNPEQFLEDAQHRRFIELSSVDARRRLLQEKIQRDFDEVVGLAAGVNGDSTASLPPARDPPPLQIQLRPPASPRLLITTSPGTPLTLSAKPPHPPSSPPAPAVAPPPTKADALTQERDPMPPATRSRAESRLKLTTSPTIRKQADQIPEPPARSTVHQQQGQMNSHIEVQIRTERRQGQGQGERDKITVRSSGEGSEGGSRDMSNAKQKHEQGQDRPSAGEVDTEGHGRGDRDVDYTRNG